MLRRGAVAALEVSAAVEPARELAPEPSPPSSVIDSAISRLQLSLEELQHLKRGLAGPQPQPPAPHARRAAGRPADGRQVRQGGTADAWRSPGAALSAGDGREVRRDVIWIEGNKIIVLVQLLREQCSISFWSWVYGLSDILCVVHYLLASFTLFIISSMDRFSLFYNGHWINSRMYATSTKEYIVYYRRLFIPC